MNWGGKASKLENFNPTRRCNFIGLCDYEAYDYLYYEICLSD
jgi:hypothetical protein